MSMNSPEFRDRRDRRRRNRILLAAVVVLAAIVMLTADFSLAHFIDNTGSSTTTMVSVDEWQPDFGTRDRWFVVLEGPGFSRKLQPAVFQTWFRRFAEAACIASNSQNHSPEAPVLWESPVYEVLGKALWLPVFAKSNDHVEWAFSSEGSVDWFGYGCAAMAPVHQVLSFVARKRR